MKFIKIDIGLIKALIQINQAIFDDTQNAEIKAYSRGKIDAYQIILGDSGK